MPVQKATSEMRWLPECVDGSQGQASALPDLLGNPLLGERETQGAAVLHALLLCLSW